MRKGREPSRRGASGTARQSLPTAASRAAVSFPPAWNWLVDEAIPAWVKGQYSPRESWKGKPFTKQDSQFFFKGIGELSELFTEERPRQMPVYFNHPKYRSAYLLYFLPLQAAKVVTIFDLLPRALEAALEHGRKSGTLRLADLGAGPGTASLALLLRLLQEKELPPRIELDWWDTHAGILEDGRALAEQLANAFPKLRGRVTVRTHVEPWWNSALSLRDTSLILVANVLNESIAASQQAMEAWTRIVSGMSGGGALVLEPAARPSSQLLSRLRDQLFEGEVLEPSPSSVWGPCLHAGRCPLAEGRDWCHFSIPVEIPGTWFREFSKALGSERQWVKFSYLWLASRAYPAQIPDAKLRRVVSDPLRKGDEGGEVLLCEPERPARKRVTGSRGPYRGDVIRV